MLVVDVDNHVCERVEAHKHELRAVANIPTISFLRPKLIDLKAGRLLSPRRNDERLLAPVESEKLAPVQFQVF